VAIKPSAEQPGSATDTVAEEAPLHRMAEAGAKRWVQRNNPFGFR